ncbi:protein translocase subunit SecF [Thermosediminibacter litoriperuensis]|uniref:Protein-export membrane protein SecF n=1 Tax=Thermosediminibacter litoriperuensis TaxID=291989 RepID=A0A5S5AFA3_9FIRM|nr:protein translocase subunit SecF [Thermosediminibacter litoriperuensis]TYP48713.1 protein translocase subunit secF [Thermosediminibacter litoriperuensis]
MRIYRIMERKWLWMSISLAVIALGLFSLGTRGLNWGIDFTGGDILHYNIGQPYSLNEARELIGSFNLRTFEVKEAGDDRQELIVRTVILSADQQKKITESIRQKWPQAQLIRAEKVDAVIGKELQRQALIALLIANIGVLIYVTFRFEFKSGVAAILALVHDVLVMISFYSIFNIPVDSTFIAVILTVVGYSINDTIVIFDRIRENLKIMGKASFDEIANTSIVQTMARSINTSITTLLSIIALYFLGGETIKDFTLALIVGIVSGAYSTIFIASPLWSMFRGQQKTARA